MNMAYYSICGSRFMEKIAAKRHPRIILVKITNRISIKAPETIIIILGMTI